MTVNRRNLLRAGAMGALLFQVGSGSVLLTPREARAQNASFQSLTARDAAFFDRLGDILVPGAAEAGFTHFIDSQISGRPADLLSILRYMDWPPPYDKFYKDGSRALNDFSQTKHESDFAELSDDDATSLIESITNSQPENWSGPPAPLFYFVTRSDAVDVVYGTMEGFDRLNIPYSAHLEPSKKW